MISVIKRIFDFAGSQTLLTAATVLAFWIKFNIVLFTFKPYTATKLFFPLFLLIIIAYCIKNFRLSIFLNSTNALLFTVIIALLVPIGYMNHPHDWGLYKEKALSLISFMTLFFAAGLLDKKGKNTLIKFIYLFCLISFFYFLIQLLFEWHYAPGHFREVYPIDRPFGILDDPDHSSGVYCVGLFLSIGFGILYKKIRYFLPIAVAFGFAIVKSQALGAFLGVIGGLLVIVVFAILELVYPKIMKGKILLSLFFGAWISVFVALAGFYFAFQNNIGGIAELISSIKPERTVLVRFDLLKLARNILIENPLFGVGFANDFNPAINSIYNTKDMAILPVSHIHTSLISGLATAGVIGFIPMCLFILHIINGYFRLHQQGYDVRFRLFVNTMFSLFIAIQILACSLQLLFSISFWFTLLLPALLLNFRKS